MKKVGSTEKQEMVFNTTSQSAGFSAPSLGKFTAMKRSSQCANTLAKVVRRRTGMNRRPPLPTPFAMDGALNASLNTFVCVY